MQIPGLVSTARVREAADALAAGHPSEASELASSAIDAEPWAATPYADRAAAQAAAGNYGAATADLREAIDREPTNWRHWLALAQVELAHGDAIGARDAFSHLRALSLASAVPHESVRALDRDPATSRAVRQGCLGYRFGACGYANGTAQVKCLAGRGTATAINTARGAVLGRVGVVKVPVINGKPVYYIAGDVGGTVTTWALDPLAYRTGIGTVIPLNDAARAASTLGTPIAPGAYNLSPLDEGARAAESCLRDR
jgi:hypothetical protein